VPARVVLTADCFNFDQTPASVLVRGSAFDHLVKVRRQRIGNLVEIQDQASSRVYRARLVSIEENQATAQIEQEVALTKALPITLICGYPKPSIADEIAQKVVELGIKRLVFFSATRTQVHSVHKREARLKRVIESAEKQSGFGEQIELSFYDSLGAVLSDQHSGTENAQARRLLLSTAPGLPTLLQQLGVVAEPTENNRELQIATPSLMNLQLHPQIADFFLVVGPEGGLTETELTTCLAWEYTAVSLGAKTLRTETACIAACSIVAQALNLPST